MTDGVSLVVIAKAPETGRSKTRLCPPCTPEEAARVAEALLRDTLSTAAATSAARRVVCLDGEPGDWLPSGFDVVPQRAGGLAERLAGICLDVSGPLLIIGMDTPQLEPSQIDSAMCQLERHDAVLGPAADGGFWALGLREPDPRVFHRVPMSNRDTLVIQRRRLRQLHLDYVELTVMRDVDTFADAQAVAAAPRAQHLRAELQTLVDRAPAA